MPSEATPTDISRPVKRILQASSKALPDLSQLEDISDWLLGGGRRGGGDGGMSDASESEAEEDSQVTLPQRARTGKSQRPNFCNEVV